MAESSGAPFHGDHEKRISSLESEVRHVAQTVESLSGKITSFLKEFNQRARTDWKTILTGLAVVVTLVVSGVSAASWHTSTVESLREAALRSEMRAEDNALMTAHETEAAHRAEIDRLLRGDYQREVDALDRRLERLETIHLRNPGDPDG